MTTLGYKEHRTSFCDLKRPHLVLIALTYKTNRGCAILWQGVNALQTKSVHKRLSDIMKSRWNSGWHRILQIQRKMLFHLKWPSTSNMRLKMKCWIKNKLFEIIFFLFQKLELMKVPKFSFFILIYKTMKKSNNVILVLN